MSIPWTEHYRPSNLADIVIEPINRRFIDNIIGGNRFPNLLFYGPPGTGKTTTIINMIKAFQKHNGIEYSGSVIHLNASDERGIDVVRNQIWQFVNTSGLFNTGVKFVILDEVDYMTKPAQQSLLQILQLNLPNIRFCLICNYIIKIDTRLYDEFIHVHFNEHPISEVITILRNILQCENIQSIDDGMLTTIYTHFKPDIRSTINYIQSNINSDYTIDLTTLSIQSFDELYQLLFVNDKATVKEKVSFITTLCRSHSICVYQFFLQFVHYLIDTYPSVFVNIDFLSFVQNTVLFFQSPQPDNIMITYIVWGTRPPKSPPPPAGGETIG